MCCALIMCHHNVVLQFLLSDIFPEVINHKIVKPVFAIVVTLLFIAPQVSRVPAPTLFNWPLVSGRRRVGCGVMGLC